MPLYAQAPYEYTWQVFDAWDAEEVEADARLTVLCERISYTRELPKDILAAGLSDVQIAEIKRVYGKSFRTCRPHFEHAFRNFFTDAWWPARLQHYGESFVMGSPEHLRIRLVMAGIMQFLETQWLGVGDHHTEEVRPMRQLVQYYRSELFLFMSYELEDIENGTIQVGDDLHSEEYKDTLCELLKEALPEDNRRELLDEFM
ncbi:MAG: hypothetical protein Q9188_001622 [Gyalolechia gomerana]